MQGDSWIISGREELQWVLRDPDWKIILKQHRVKELPENYCTKFTEDCCIENKEIRDKIIEAIEGVPLYLNVSVDHFEKISQKREPTWQIFQKHNQRSAVNL